jgi:tRNA pseudouridine38-40 synthase
VIAFTYDGRLAAPELERALAALLPPDIGLGQLRRVARNYRPRHRAKYREYRYSIWNGQRSPLRERHALGVRDPLDAAAMAAAGEALLGRHDFSAFGGADRQPVRTLYVVRTRRRGRWITITVIGDAFLRQMVRRIVAGLVRVGRGQATIEDVATALRSRRPAFAGETAPAHGLTLWRVPMGPAHKPRMEQEDDDDEQDI